MGLKKLISIASSDCTSVNVPILDRPIGNTSAKKNKLQYMHSLDIREEDKGYLEEIMLKEGDGIDEEELADVERKDEEKGE